jgi:ketosteroid isomerase-like protein
MEDVMIDAMEVVETMCERYQTAVSNNDSGAYRKLFAEDAIRIPPGSEPERGPDEIAQSEQRDYDAARWTVRSTSLDALRIDDNWIYGVAEADIDTVAYADGARKSFRATKTWLLQRQPSGDWLIKRQMWNLK